MLAHLTRFSVPMRRMTTKACFTNITYSGGQCYDGQGGFCGSAGANNIDAEILFMSQFDEAVVHAEDMKKLAHIMNQVQSIMGDEPSSQLSRDHMHDRIKNLLQDPYFVECLGRLEYKAGPVWGLSCAERKMVSDARKLVNHQGMA